MRKQKMNINYSKYDLTPEEVEILKEEIAREEALKKKSKKGFPLTKILSLILVILCLSVLGVSGYYGYEIVNAADKTVVCEENSQNSCNNDIFNGLFQTFTSNEENIKIKGEEEGRTNALVIGTDEAGGLTDVIILVSFFHKERKVVTLNFPRDLYVSTNFTTDSGQTKYVSEKINAVYPLAQRESSREEAGSRAISNFISNEFQIPIHYWVTTNFKGVEKVIDELGGVDVEVDKAFTDCQYPNKNYGYLRPCPSFEVGTESMDGTRALIYARSRMAAEDGGDFARSRRQSIVMEATAKKAKEKGIAGNINSINNYVNIVSDYVRTNVRPSEVLGAYKKYKDTEVEGNFLRVVWSDNVGIFCQGPSSRGYNLVYCGGAILGVESGSPYREKAREQVKNLLQTAKLQQLNEMPVSYFGNQSNDTVLARTYFSNLGLQTTYFNNSYSTQIESASSASIEKVNIYISDNETLKTFESILKTTSNKPPFDFEIKDKLPLDKVLPSQVNNSGIIIWVESV
jgi:LCP family protein required for cell wall assembly